MVIKNYKKLKLFKQTRHILNKMSRQYKNFTTKLNKYKAIILTNEEDYIESKKTEKYPEFIIRCTKGHTFSLKWTSLHNKLKIMETNPERNICAECEKPDICGEETNAINSCKKLGFQFISYEIKTRKVKYKRVCGQISSTHATNINREIRSAKCVKCQNNKFRIKTETVRNKLKEYGCTLLEDYVNTHVPIKFICDCGEKIKMRYSEFILGKRCKYCGNGVICDHNIYRNECKDCSQTICKHNKYTTKCVACIEEKLCEHGEYRTRCIMCYPNNACKTCDGEYVSKTSNYYPNCFKCFCIMNPGVEISKNYRFKEHYLRDYLKEEFPEISFTFNKTLRACSKRRPDIFVECYTHAIIIECDEYQHRNYSCENKRVMEIFQDLGSRPLIVLQFNPDSYINKNGERIQGCFKRAQKGNLVLLKLEWNRRLKSLKKLLLHHFETIPTKEITIVKLFYTLKQA